MLRFLCVALLAVVVSSTSAQLNLMVGYNPAIGSFERTNAALARYAPSKGEVTQPFKKLSFIHGVSLGVRYKLDKTMLELAWHNAGRDRTALSYDSSTDSFDERKYDFTLNTFSIGADQYFGAVGVGTAIGRSSYKIKRSVDSNSLDLDNTSYWTADIHLNWRVQQSKTVSVVLRPYYQIGLSDADVSGLLSDIGIKPTSNERVSLFGLSFLFYNGRQR